MYALQGIARLIESKMPTSYLVGHWKHDIPQSLVWYTPFETSRTLLDIPSWSWGSVLNHHYDHHYDQFDQWVPLATLDDVTYASLFHRQGSGPRLRIRGVWKQLPYGVDLKPDVDRIEGIDWTELFHSSTTASKLSFPGMTVFLDSHQGLDMPTLPLSCLILGAGFANGRAVEGILLQEIDNENDGPVCKRVGKLHTYYPSTRDSSISLDQDAVLKLFKNEMIQKTVYLV